MRFKAGQIIIFLFLIIPELMKAQQPAFRNYTVDDGLPSSEIYHVIQDSKGYIWLATNMGVSRFDGREFRNFDVQNGLPENTVFEIYEDNIGRLWFVSFPFQLSYFENDSIHPYKYNDKLRELAGHGLVPLKKSFLVNSKDDVLFSFLNDGKIYKLDKEGKIHILENISGSSKSVKILEYDQRLLAAQNGDKATTNYLIVFQNNLINYTSSIVNSIGRFTFSNIMMERTKNNGFLFIRNEFLTQISNKGLNKVYDLKDRILWMNTESDGSIWIGKESGGAERYNINNLNGPPIESYLNGQAVSSIFTDNEGGIWFSTLGSGLFYLPTRAFISYTTQDCLSGKNVLSIEIFKGTPYIGSEDFSPDIILDGKILHTINKKNDDTFVNVLTAYDNERLWIGCKTNLFYYDGKTFTKVLNNHPKILNQNVKRKYIFSIKEIHPVSSDTVLLAQMRSISVVAGSKVIYDSYLDDNIPLRVEAIDRESDSSFLLGTFNGLWRFSKTRKLAYLGADSELLNKRITALLTLPNQEGYILGTKGFGLILKIREKLIKITQNEGLSSNSITSLELMGDTLWVATNNGLNRINLNDYFLNGRISVFTKEHGLISNEINKIKAHNSLLYIACNGGLTIFNTKKYHALTNSPPVFINEFSIMERDTIVKSGYILDHDQNFIIIGYGGINFRDAGQLLYKYRLIGLSENWVYSRNVQVEYAFLPSGIYKFEVYAINSEGKISNQPAILEFRILPPFWKTWWFISAVIFTILFLFYTYFNLRIQTLRKQHNLQNDINKYREQALIRQMDPHFVFNSLNSIQSFIIKNDSVSSSHYLSKFARLMRIILNNSQKQAVRLSDEIDALSLYMELESMRFKQKFEHKITVDPAIETELIFIPAFLVQPFIENAIWHGIMHLEKPGFIHINYILGDSQIICTIEDNGIGRVKSSELKSENDKKRKSMGVAIVESRLNVLSDFYKIKMKVVFTDVYDANNLPAGTRVTINLPIVKSEVFIK